jgi:hypothetical protein
LDVDLGEAARTIAEVDRRENTSRAARLTELEALLTDDVVGFSGQAAVLLFDDIKATWIHGFFTATILAAYAFCVHQLAGLLRLLPDDPTLPDRTTSLEELAAVNRNRGVINIGLHAQLVTLHDSAMVYFASGLHEYDAEVERRAAEASLFSDGHGLLGDARSALLCSVALLHRR